MRRLKASLLASVLLVFLAACSGSDPADEKRTGHYEEVCAACGATWMVDVASFKDDRLEVTIQIENTGELGPLDIRGEQVLAVTFSQPAKEAWLKDYGPARAEGRLVTTDLPRVLLTPSGDTRLPTRLESQQKWTGTFVAARAPEDVQAVMVSFQSFVAINRPGSPSTFTSRDARRPFINIGEEITVAAVPTSTPRSGPRQLGFQGSIPPAANDASALLRHRFVIDPWVTGVTRVTIQPPLPGGDPSGAVSSYNLTRVGTQSVLELGIPTSVARQQFTLTVQLADGQSVSAQFNHSP